MRKNKRLLSLLLVILFALFMISCGKVPQASSVNNAAAATDTSVITETAKVSGEMKIHYIDVGQGDSELIQVEGKNILIDAGTSDKKALNYLKSIGVTTLDYVIATHPHEDHIGSMDDVINEFNIGTFYSPKAITTTKTFENMINALKSKNLKLTVPKVGDVLTIGNATLTFLAPNSDKYEDLNNYSIVCKLKYGNNSFLFDGDAEALSEGEILAKQLDIQADVLKVGHHGSISSTSQAFLDKVNPKYAIISDAKGNDYGHPHQKTLDKLNSKQIKTFRTDLNGTIIATSNGTDITFNVNPIDNSVNVAGDKTEAATKNSSTVAPVVADSNLKTNTTSANQNEEMVWVANKTAKVYHSTKTCSNMKNPTQMSLADAQAKGLTPCSKCH
ncbi:competence protein ComE [Clostridium gelidum]|uniref:Competence protein ComE n=1 Tax=Clostridium gelidum TaxID=704125 RepID=A0ABN6IZP1_9CLOT|nr:ComEC/Rec2 family competence protein [Clostridium gelidum]BCZ46908.1 competence protein ComE [Clostridium gelidum]